MTDRQPLLELRDLTVDYPTHDRLRRQAFRAVDGVSLTLAASRTLGLVGESGSGKSTIGNAVLGLVRPSGGQIRYRGKDITRAGPRQRRSLARHLQVVFQDPYSSLNPSRTIGQTLADPLRARGRRSGADARIGDLLERVGLSADAAHRYPAQFSGGQRQRIAIARALVLEPDIVICDEPTSSLDLSVQAQVLNLLQDLQDKLELSYLFISHDIGVVRHVAHDVAVLLHGQLVEYGPVDAVTTDPSHPYTQALLAATPVADPRQQAARRRARTNAVNSQQMPPPVNAGAGCPFAGRCAAAMPVCRQHRPAPRPSGTGVQVACHLYPEPTATDSTLAAATPLEEGARPR